MNKEKLNSAAKACLWLRERLERLDRNERTVKQQDCMYLAAALLNHFADHEDAQHWGDELGKGE